MRTCGNPRNVLGLNLTVNFLTYHSIFFVCRRTTPSLYRVRVPCKQLSFTRRAPDVGLSLCKMSRTKLLVHFKTALMIRYFVVRLSELHLAVFHSKGIRTSKTNLPPYILMAWQVEQPPSICSICAHKKEKRTSKERNRKTL